MISGATFWSVPCSTSISTVRGQESYACGTRILILSGGIAAGSAKSLTLARTV